MRAPTITLDDNQEVPLDRAPLDALRAFVGGCFDNVENGPSDNPIVAQRIAKFLLDEREAQIMGSGAWRI